jgi:ribosomal protein S18 acetylase RimI-like enzyme
VPDDGSLTLRRAEPRDALELAAVHIGSWQVAYRGLVPKEFLDALNVEERASRYRFGAGGSDEPEMWLAAQDNVVAGLVVVGRSRDEDQNSAGEVWSLYVAPSNWRSGIGSRLLGTGEDLLAQRGYEDATLWVLEGNSQARQFYEGAGWRFDGTRQTIDVGGHDLSEVRYFKSLTSD